ncbi:sugar kinase [Rossellomorea sp. NPDC077527]|uniref:sugar kinase n=1 Tax=Rossellomorea sp. NPDC077527 TaxID=3364510 RepID=UPI0037C6C53F
MAEVTTIGETMILLSNENGEMLRSPSLSKRIGGAESNVAIGLTRLGHKVNWISKLGVDPFGEEILYHLRGEGVEVSYVVRDPDNRTGIMIKDRRGWGDPDVYYYRDQSAASKLQWGEVNLDALRDTKILHLTGITPALSASCRNVTLRLIEYGKKNGIPISFDPNLRLKLWDISEARSFILSILPHVDYFLPGIGEARLLAGVDQNEASTKELCHFFHMQGAHHVVMKLGEGGCAVSSDGHFQKIKGYEITPLDTVGAGDGFCAGFLSGVLSGLSLWEAAIRGNAVGAIAASTQGDYDGLPRESALQHFLGNDIEVKR